MSEEENNEENNEESVGDELDGDELGSDELGSDELGSDELGGDELGGDELGDAVAEQEDSDAGADWGDAMAEQETTDNVEAQKLEKLTDSGNVGDVNLDVVMDIPVSIALEIGRTKISIRNLLKLNQGSVVELDRLAGEPLDVLVNNTLVAHGEVVVVNDKFGIRLTDVISREERLKNLK
jgi:flagellar motor switch protein FliN/FliY